MAKYSHARSNFTFGEVSPSMYGRTDLQQYAEMCETLENFTVLPQGGVRRRKGTRFVLDLASHIYPRKMIPFMGTNGEAYLILLGDTGIRAVRCSAGTVTTPSSMETSTYGINYSYTWPTPFDLQGLGFANIQHTQYGDLLVLTSPTNEPLGIRRISATTFVYARLTRAEILVAPSGVVSIDTAQGHRTIPWREENTTAVTISASATAVGAVTLTASAAFFTPDMAATNSGALESSGTWFRIRHGAGTADIGIVRVNSYVNSTTMTGFVTKALGSGAATANWAESAWSDRSGFPRTCLFFQSRLWMAGNSRLPDTFWASQINDLSEISRADITAAPNDTDAFEITPAFGTVSPVNVLSADKKLFFSTGTREGFLSELDSTAGLSINNTEFVLQTSVGSALVGSIRYDNTLAFVDRSKKGIKELIFDFREDSYKSRDLRYFSDSIFGTDVSAIAYIKEMVYQNSEKITWLRFGFDLYAFTRDKEYDILAWHRHVLGGNFSDGVDLGYGTTDPAVYCMATIPNLATGSDDLWLVVVRNDDSDGGSSEEFFLEVIEGHGSGDIESIAGQYMDSSFAAVYTSPTVWTAAHLPSQTVSVIADGEYIGEKTLSAAGVLTLDSAATSVYVGYNYTSTLETTALQSNSLFGSGLGTIKRTEELIVLFDRTVGAKVGVSDDESNLQELQFREMSVPANDPTPLFTGEKILKVRAPHRANQKVMIKQDKPLPMTVSALVVKGLLYD